MREISEVVYSTVAYYLSIAEITRSITYPVKFSIGGCSTSNFTRARFTQGKSVPTLRLSDCNLGVKILNAVFTSEQRLVFILTPFAVFLVKAA
jgi:hypothetical protein